LLYEEKEKIFSFAEIEISIKIIGSYSPYFKRSDVCFPIFGNIILKDDRTLLNRMKIKINIIKNLKRISGGIS